MRTFFQCSLHIYTLFTSGGNDIWQRWVQVAETLIAESSSFSRREESDSLRTQKSKSASLKKYILNFFAHCDILLKAFGSKHCKVPKKFHLLLLLPAFPQLVFQPLMSAQTGFTIWAEVSWAEVKSTIALRQRDLGFESSFFFMWTVTSKL